MNGVRSEGSPTPTPSRSPWRYVRDLAMAFYAMVCAPVLLLALTLLWHAETAAGRCFSILVLLAIPFPIVLMLCLRWSKRRTFRTISLALTAGIPAILYLFLGVTAPSGWPIKDAPVGSVFLNGAPSRWTPSGIVPEIDQVKLGIVLSPYYDALMTPTKADRLLDSAMPLYREMRARPEYESLGNVLGSSYAEIYGGTVDVGHCYYVVPTHKDNERLPLIVFLHGSGGNMKAYTYLWQGWAERLHCAVICPSYGFGNWGSGTLEAVERAQTWAIKNLPVDSERMFLAGLSNGGLGVCRMAAATPTAFRGLILFSPVLDGRALRSRALQDGCSCTPVLCITGAIDERVPADYVRANLRLLPNHERNVVLLCYEERDHFLFFTAKDRVVDDLVKWWVPSLTEHEPLNHK